MNIKDLRDSLLESFEALKEGKLKTKEAKEITNMSGKIILSAKVELDYNKFMKLGRKIDFLDVIEEKTGSNRNNRKNRKVD